MSSSSALTLAITEHDHLFTTNQQAAMSTAFILLLLELGCWLRPGAVHRLLSCFGLCGELMTTPGFNLETCRDRMADVARGVAYCCGPVAILYALSHHDFAMAAIRATILAIIVRYRPGHGGLLTIWRVVCFVMFPARASLLWFDVLPSQASLVPGVIVPMVFGAVLHDSVASHLSGVLVLMATSLVIASHLQISPVMVPVAAGLSVCALIAKISWLQHQMKLRMEWKHVLCIAIPLNGYLVLLRLHHAYPQILDNLIREHDHPQWLAVALVPLLLALGCWLRPGVVNHQLSCFGACGDLQGTPGFDLEAHRERMADLARGVIYCCCPALILDALTHHDFATAAIRATILVIIVRYRPGHGGLLSIWRVVCFVAFPARASLAWFDVLPNPASGSPGVIGPMVVGAMLHESVASHLSGVLVVVAASTAFLPHDFKIACVVQALVSCIILVAKLAICQKIAEKEQQWRLEAQLSAMNEFREVLDHQIKNILMGSASMVHESQTLIQSLLPQLLDAEIHQAADKVNEAVEMLQLARDSLDEGSEECYQQQVLREVSNGSYQPRPQRVDIGHQLARSCRQAKLATPDKFYLDTDTTLMRHLLQNAQNNGLKYGSTEHSKLTLTFQLQPNSPLQADSRDVMLTIELTNRAGPTHSLLLEACDTEGRIEMNGMLELSQQQSADQSSGLGATIMRKCAKLLNATFHLQIRADTTTFVLCVPTRQHKAPLPSLAGTPPATQGSNVSIGSPPEAALISRRPTIAAVVDDQNICRKMMKADLCKNLGFSRVDTFGETAASIIGAAEVIASATIPLDVIFVDNSLTIDGLTEAETQGTSLLRTLRSDLRVSGMCVLTSAETCPDNAAEYHCFISKDRSGFVENFSNAWSEFIRTRPLHGKRLCIVDDTPLAVKLVTTELYEAGASVWQVESGNEFLELGAELDFPWDVILLDFSMPGLTGIETLQRIKPHIKARLQVIGFSTQESTAAGYLKAGAFAFIRKTPSAYNELEELILGYEPDVE